MPQEGFEFLRQIKWLKKCFNLARKVNQPDQLVQSRQFVRKIVIQKEYDDVVHWIIKSLYQTRFCQMCGTATNTFK